MKKVPLDQVLLGDNLGLLRERFPDACVDLVYLDPPFQSGQDYVHFSDRWPWNEAVEANYHAFTEHGPEKPAWLIQHLYGLLGPHDTVSYLVMMAPRLVELHRVLKPFGSLYLHCDPAMSHYLKVLADLIFGPEHFRNEIIWRIGWISGFKSKARKWIRNHDVILYYVKSRRFTFNKIHLNHTYGYRRRGGQAGKAPGIPLEDVWGISNEEGLTSIHIMSFSREKLGWPTQKPEALLDRIVSASSNPMDLVLDPFCGSGTTLAVAARLSRHWVGMDISPEAVALSQKRVQNLAPLFPAGEAS